VEAATTLDREACEALTTAGYRAREARSAVVRARAHAHVGIETTLEHLIREGLRQCAVAGGTGRDATDDAIEVDDSGVQVACHAHG